MPRGRPRTLPSSLPRLSPEVVLDPELQHVEIQSRRALAQEASARRRLQQQERVAEDHARQRAKRQIEELTMAYKHAQLAAEKTSKKMERLAQKKAEQQRQLDQLRLAVEGGEHEMTPSEERQLRNVAGYGNEKPRLTGADEAGIMELAGMLPQAKIGERIGVSQSTVSRHLRKTAPNRRKTGRHVKLTREMLFAAARFQFIFNTTSLQRTCAFIGLSYGVKVHPRTMSRHLKRTAGFRLGDLRRFPRDRNSERAIQDRFRYATDMPQKFGQNTLYEAVYFDEMKLSRCTKRKA